MALVVLTVPPADDLGVVSGGGGVEVPDTLPLVPVPPGCRAPAPPHVVFVGKVVDRDVRTVRYRVESVRFGRTEPFAGGDLVDVRYGLDTQYLVDGRSYLVAAAVDPDLGVLHSRVREPVEDFGGDEVIGVSESDVDCPDFEDPTMTLGLDGTPVAAGILDPFLGARAQLLAAIGIPVALAVGAVFLLSTLRLSLGGMRRSIVSGRRQPRRGSGVR